MAGRQERAALRDTVQGRTEISLKFCAAEGRPDGKI